MNALAARPHENTITAKNAVAQPMIGARRNRSASQPIGSAPSTRNAPDAALMNTIAPSLTPKVSRMSGASTDRTAFSSSSTDWISSSITNVKTPPSLTPCLQGHLFAADAREEVVGEQRFLLVFDLQFSTLGLGVEHRASQPSGSLGRAGLARASFVGRHASAHASHVV